MRLSFCLAARGPDLSTTRPKPFVNRRLSSPWRPGRRLWVFLALFLVALFFAWWLFHKPQAAPVKRSVPVSVTQATVGSMPVQLKSIGNTTPINSVSIKSLVSGQIIAIHFREGQFVTAGQLLFNIDPRALEAALQGAQADVANKQALVQQAAAAITKDQAALVQAQANKARDIATANNAIIEAKRYASLARVGAVSTEQYQQYQTTSISAQATVKADQAVIGNVQAMIKADRASLNAAKAQLAQSVASENNARVQLSYANITAPISGLAGNLQVLKGNVVQADNQTLVTVNQIYPIEVSLTVPEQQFSEVRHYAASGTVAARAYGATGGLLASNGTLVFENNQVDTTTGTVMLKAVFPNSEQNLWPGQFVNVVLTLTTIPRAVVVPERCVQTGQDGLFIWVVRSNHTVHMQPVTVGQSSKGMTAITSGIRSGTTVVTDGQMQLSEGTLVSISQMKGL